MTIAIICGGRNFCRVPTGTPAELRYAAILIADYQISFLRAELDRLHAMRGITEVWHTATMGTSYHAGKWAASHRLKVREFPSPRSNRHRVSERSRNREMLELGPDLVVVFKGGRSTNHLLRDAIAAGIDVIDFRRHALSLPTKEAAE